MVARVLDFAQVIPGDAPLGTVGGVAMEPKVMDGSHRGSRMPS
ncbi:hypothetical protein SAMN04489867_2269 [Pedococcus dokdonensis]|uniref:Uncharacterized protein n=1 Tax=Pedococcus dokdonensis TaxID=443156 RepID=A0A1H0SA28_9MICO|nr:hypothetical protein [Pedococcus dokdonensis]SDP38623.1 hypothetical protein SAMN04489867_2269 [Pedococcus dokdonensis]